MDRQTALLVLQLPDTPSPDEVHDAFEAHVFGLRDFLFRQTVVPQVFRAKVDRLVTASEVGETLGVELPCLDDRLPDLDPLEGTADQVVRIHADNVGRLRTSMAATLSPTCLSRLGECLVKRQNRFVEWMAAWSADRNQDGAKVKPMRDEWFRLPLPPPWKPSAKATPSHPPNRTTSPPNCCASGRSPSRL